MFFKKMAFLKTELHLCFPLFSLLEPLMQCNLDTNVVGRLRRHKRFGSPGIHMYQVLFIFEEKQNGLRWN